jgi:hypothetical protein
MPGALSTISMPDMAGMAQAASGWDTAGAILLLLWAITMWAAVGGLWYANRGTARPWVYRASLTVIVIGVIGQIGHLTEHVAQAGYRPGPRVRPGGHLQADSGHGDPALDR